MAAQQYFAHSATGTQFGSGQPLLDHLTGVAAIARTNGAKFGAAEAAYLAGLLHDLGKYSLEFQRKLAGENIRVDHSTAGAYIAAQENRFGPVGKLIAYAIAGHHAGLANGVGTGSPNPLSSRLAKEAVDALPRFDAWAPEIEPLLPAEVRLSLRQPPDKERHGFCAALLVRMLFSTLVDADRLDTEAFYSALDAKTPPRGGWSATILSTLNAKLDAYLKGLARGGQASDVNKARAEILAAAGRKALECPGLFSLSVPTGGGKTLSSLAFALGHAVAHNLDRVIYVIPFTSIIEQTAGVFRKAFGADLEHCVIEHHSAYREPREAERGESERQAGERARLAMENWDAPVIITTAVQFFESLFSNRPGQCRKLHNIAKSVVILDEAQTLPLAMLRPCVAAFDELARSYGASIVLCTATQPALQAARADGSPGFKGGLAGAREIADAPGLTPGILYARLKRVTIKPAVELDDDALADRLRSHDRVLCIVGTRKHARELYQKLGNEPGTFHLSALMCPVHRTKKLNEIKTALEKGPCRLVATTVIEAGVDVDFPFVYRAMAGLDSIAQAAGRCNREGRRRLEESFVQIFEPKDRAPIPELRKFEQAARSVFRNPAHAADPLSLAAIEAYFSELYWCQEAGRDDRLDPHGIAKSAGCVLNREDAIIPFADIARDFRMIKTEMEPVIVPYDEEARRLLDALTNAEHAGAVARKLQPYMVNVPRGAFAGLRQAGRIETVNPYRFGEQFMALNEDGLANLYHEEFGFDWSDATFRTVENGIL